jgi:hypothetical protein
MEWEKNEYIHRIDWAPSHLLTRYQLDFRISISRRTIVPNYLDSRTKSAGLLVNFSIAVLVIFCAIIFCGVISLILLGWSSPEFILTFEVDSKRVLFAKITRLCLYQGTNPLSFLSLFVKLLHMEKDSKKEINCENILFFNLFMTSPCGDVYLEKITLNCLTSFTGPMLELNKNHVKTKIFLSVSQCLISSASSDGYLPFSLYVFLSDNWTHLSEVWPFKNFILKYSSFNLWISQLLIKDEGKQLIVLNNIFFSTQEDSAASPSLLPTLPTNPFSLSFGISSVISLTEFWKRYESFFHSSNSVVIGLSRFLVYGE